MNDWDDENDNNNDYIPTESAPGPTYKLTLDGLTQNAIVDAVIRQLASDTTMKLTAEHNAQIKATIEQSVQAAVERILDSRLDKEVNAILDEGWQQYDRWGSPAGPRTTLKELVTKYIMTEVDQHGRDKSDHYSSDSKKNRINWFVERAVNTLFDKEITKLVEDFRVKVKERFNAEIAAKVAETLKKAIGL